MQSSHMKPMELGPSEKGFEKRNFLLMVLGRLNLYRSVNSDGVTFDNTYLRMENFCSLFALFMIGVSVISFTLYYAYSEIIITYDERAQEDLGYVSMATFAEIGETHAHHLIGRVSCDCTNIIIPYGEATGGPINSTDFELDGICTGWEGVVTSPRKNFIAINLTQPGAGAQIQAEGCANVSQLNPGMPAASWDSVTPHAECAIVHMVTYSIIEDLNRLCKTALQLNHKTLQIFLTDSFMTNTLLHRELLDTYMKNTLEYMAAQNGLRMFSSSHNSISSSADFAENPAKMRRSSLYDLKGFESPCDDFPLGPTSNKSSLRSVFSECSLNPFFTGHCCNSVTKQCITYRMPCSEEMHKLGQRISSSEYADVREAVEGAFLMGMSEASRVERKEELGLAPVQGQWGKAPTQATSPAGATPSASAGASSGASGATSSGTSGTSASGTAPSSGGRRLELKRRRGGRQLSTSTTNHTGGFTLGPHDTSVEMFTRYYHACQPSVCTYVTRQPPAGQRLLLIVAGLVGGIVAAGKAAGLGFLLTSKLYLKICHRGKVKVEPDQNSAAGSVDIIGSIT